MKSTDLQSSNEIWSSKYSILPGVAETPTICRKLILSFVLGLLCQVNISSAGEIDLTAVDALTSHVGATGGTLLAWHSSGSISNGIGSNDAFLELNQQGSNDEQQGYNTDASIQFSTTQSAEALLLSDVPVVNISGTQYLEFGLGLNATGGDPYHSLDEFQIFQSDSNTLDSYSTASDQLNGLNPVFDWFGDDPNSFAVLSDDVSGQSNIDYLFYVPLSAIDPNSDYIYLYAEMGFTNGNNSCLGTEDCDANAGEDRWVVDRSDPPAGYCLDVDGISCLLVPEPTSIMLGLLGSMLCFYRRL